jgi:hypothetical protein
MRSEMSRVGAVVIGRRLFDITNGWGGVPAAGDRVAHIAYAVRRT